MFKKIALMLIGSFMLCTPSIQAKEIVIKFSHVTPLNHPKAQMAIRLQELVDQRLKGKVRVEVFPNSQLFTDDEVLEAMMLGDVQMAAPALAKFQKYTKKLQLFDLPFLFENMVAVERFQSSSEGQKLLDSLKPKGFVGLGYIHNGLKQLSANTPLRVPGDAKKLKFRIMTSDVLAAQFKALGAMPLKKSYSEVFSLLQTKAIDGQENTWSNIYSKKFFEVQKYITESNHGVLDYLLVVTQEFWGSLPNEIRAELNRAIDESIAYGNEVATKLAVEDKQKIVDSKRTEVLKLSKVEHAQWVEVMKSVWKQFESEIGKELIDAAYSSNNI